MNHCYLKRLLSNYWVESADLVFGDFMGCIAFVKQAEGLPFLNGLIEDLNDFDQNGLLPHSENISKRQMKIWSALGSRWLDLRGLKDLMSFVEKYK